MIKEEVFSIMGKYYGNAYFRAPDLTAEEAKSITLILDKINALGYQFSNLHKLEEVSDERFIEIILKSYYDYSDCLSLGCKEELLCGLSHKEYKQAVPALLKIYDSLDYDKDYRLKYRTADIIAFIRNKNYENEYVNIISQESYKVCDGIYALVCDLKSQSALPRIIELVMLYPSEFKFIFLKCSWKYREEKLIPYYQMFLDDSSSEIRTMAKNAIKKYI